MKKLVTEGKLGLEYIADAISSCEQNGIECIADDDYGVILFYDPKGRKYADSKFLMNSDVSIHELLADKDLYEHTMQKAEGEGFKKFSIQWNDLQKKEDGDGVYKSKTCNPIRGNFTEGIDDPRDWSSNEEEVEIQWMIDDKELGIVSGSTESFVIDLDLVDCFEELVYQVTKAMEGEYGGMTFDYDDEWIFTDEDKWLKRFGYNMNEQFDDPRDWSSSEGEVEIMWTVDYPEFGIEAGNTDNFVVDYDNVAPDNEYDIENNGLRDEICRLISDEYPGLDFEPYDFDIMNEREFWGDQAKASVHPYDEGRKAGFEVVEDIPVWASNYFLYKDETDLNDVDMKLIFDFVEKLKKRGLRLFEPIPGTENKYNDSPAFGYGTSTEDWYARKIVSEHNFMNESGSNGGVIDVTLKFTHGHYGKKLKAGEEKTIKLDTSTAPTIYDADDMLTWIAKVASDQIPGGGEVTKYDFETIEPPDDVLIKAVMGDEGFGPDVDVDFEDFEPEDVPSEISYKDALKFYQKMHDAYDDRKLDYTKYDKIRNKLMDAVVKGLLKEKSLDELADEWFINYGTMNGWGWKTSFKYNVACALHEIHKKKHPDEHAVDREDTIRGWHSEKCSCGLASSSDSSD